jgi:hypothetical protein
MRRDLILPALLVTALMAMAVYATTGARSRVAELVPVPALCDSPGHLDRLAHLAEASGLAASRRRRGILWSLNDSADATLYAIGPNASLSGRVRLAGASVVDWEAVAVGPCGGNTCVFVGDIGDNDRARRSITIYRTTEPLPSDETTAPVEAFEAVYPEGPQDAEGLFVARETLFIVTKGEGAPVRVYKFPAVADTRPVTLELVMTLTAGDPRKQGRVTDAAVSPDGHWVALRTNDLVLFYKTSALLAGRAAAPLAFDLRPLREPQGEGIAWADNQTLFLAGEAPGGGTFGRISCSLPPG